MIGSSGVNTNPRMAPLGKFDSGFLDPDSPGRPLAFAQLALGALWGAGIFECDA